MKLDKLDLQLLTELQTDGSLTSEQLSERVALSPSAISRRVRRLESEKVIERRLAVIDSARVGHGALFIVGVEVERERPELVQKLRAWMTGEPSVQQAYYVTGTADYVMLVTAPDIAAFDRMMSEMMAANPNVSRFTTQVVMSMVKRGLFVPVCGA
ncbi:MAG TPA: Lrp/AsnC family transcriptional regulator [Sphingomicrobium sp.]|nr:Lrp/AsnC family transcriptional regulator [Sphingomicrobium sp.]